MNCAAHFQDCVQLPLTNGERKLDSFRLETTSVVSKRNESSFLSLILSVFVKIPPCRSLCEAFDSQCGSLLPSNLVIDCQQIDPNTGFFAYPEESITYSYNGMLYTFPCNNLTQTGLDGKLYYVSMNFL